MPLASVSQASGKPSLGDPSGTWRGHSECTIKDSPCHDETNIYRFSKIAGKPGTFTGVGSKIVDGKEVVMGTLEWSYDPQKQSLTSSIPTGTFLLNINGDTIEGSILLPDHTVFRRIHLEKEK
jgi:hypothetical protein